MPQHNLSSAPSGTYNNSKLPFDILSVIFSDYAEDDSPAFPLETLLLVCHFWKNTALEHRSMWSKFKVELDTVANAVQWESTIRRRLERSGPDSPIYFQMKPKLQFRLFNHMPSLRRILEAIVGRNGCLCARWKEIDLNLDVKSFTMEDRYFAYPTPNLTSLTIKRLTLNRENGGPSSGEGSYLFFPSAPMLRNVSISYSRDIPFPDISNATRVEVIHCDSLYSFPRCLTDPSVLTKLSQLQTLVLGYSCDVKPYDLPTDMQSLVSLHFGSRNLPTNIVQVHFPLLQHLSLDYTVGDVRRLLQCPGIPFQSLKGLTFMNMHRLCDDEDPTESYKALLKKCHQVQNISCDKVSLEYIFSVIGSGALDDSAILTHAVNFRVPTRFAESEIRFCINSIERYRNLDERFKGWLNGRDRSPISAFRFPLTCKNVLRLGRKAWA